LSLSRLGQNQGLRRIEKQRHSPDTLAEECLKRLVLGTHNGGGRITERWIVEQFGVTHSQAREALHRLEKRGALTLSPRRGAKLASPAQSNPADMRPVWVALVELAVKLAAQGNRPVAAPKVARKRDPWSKHKHVEAIIESLCDAGGNMRLKQALQRLAVEAAASRGASIDAEVLEKLIEHLSAGRVAAAERLVGKTFAARQRAAGARQEAAALLRGAAPTAGPEVGAMGPQIRAFLYHVAELIGPAADRAPPAAHQIAAAIRRRIQFGELRPGDAVRELPLARAFGVSRGPVRDALRLLDRQGLVTVEGRRGAFVRRFSVKSAIDIMQVRAAISGVLMAEAAAAADRPAWIAHELKAGVALLKAIAADRNSPLGNFILVRHGVAVLTVAACGNAVIGRIAAELADEVTVLWATVLSKDRQKKSAQTWEKIVVAIIARDVEVAGAYGRQIVEDAFTAALETAELRAAEGT
jgi:DNA-binding GntR family transcriptional regulator